MWKNGASVPQEPFFEEDRKVTPSQSPTSLQGAQDPVPAPHWSGTGYPHRAAHCWWSSLFCCFASLFPSGKSRHRSRGDPQSCLVSSSAWGSTQKWGGNCLLCLNVVAPLTNRLQLLTSSWVSDLRNPLLLLMACERWSTQLTRDPLMMILLEQCASQWHEIVCKLITSNAYPEVFDGSWDMHPEFGV